MTDRPLIIAIFSCCIACLALGVNIGRLSNKSATVESPAIKNECPEKVSNFITPEFPKPNWFPERILENFPANGILPIDIIPQAGYNTHTTLGTGRRDFIIAYSPCFGSVFSTGVGVALSGWLLALQPAGRFETLNTERDNEAVFQKPHLPSTYVNAGRATASIIPTHHCHVEDLSCVSIFARSSFNFPLYLSTSR